MLAMLDLHPRPADPEDRPALARVVDGGDRLGDDARVAECVSADEEPQSRALGLPGPRAEQRVALEEVLVGIAEDGVEVIPRPEVGVAQAIDALGGVEHLVPGRGLAPEQDPELDVGHWGPPGMRAGSVKSTDLSVPSP